MTGPSRSSTLSDFRTDRRVLLLSALAVPIGVIGALVATGLLWLIAAITNLAFFHRLSVEPVTPQQHDLGVFVILVPVIGAVLIGMMARYGSEKIRGHGIPEAIEAILLGRSLIDPKVAVLKPVSSAISIGTGGPFGAEGPIIMTGGAFGSIFAQLFHLSAPERKTLLVAGAAAGMAAVFASPMAAVLLGVELLLFEWRPRSFIPVAMAAITASVMRVPLIGAGPIFPIVPHADPGPTTLAIALVIGVAGGFVSGLLTMLVYACEDLFERLRLHWMWWPAIGAVVVGVAGWFDPRVLGVGYGIIHDLVRGSLLGQGLVSLLLAKGIVWAIALGSGTSGGVLAPLLIIGGALGALLGTWIPGADPGLSAMIGMSAMMGGTMRSPLTATIFVLELTHDFAALPGLLVGTVAALCVTVLLMRRSILTEKLARRGQHIAREYGVDPLEIVRVGEVMDPDPPLIAADTTVAAYSAMIAHPGSAISRRQAAIVVDADGRLAGILTRDDARRALDADVLGQARVQDAAMADPPRTWPDEPLRDALRTMSTRGVGRLPVIAREPPCRVVGYLGRAEVLQAQVLMHEAEEHRERRPLRRDRRTGATDRGPGTANRGPIVRAGQIGPGTCGERPPGSPSSP